MDMRRGRSATPAESWLSLPFIVCACLHQPSFCRFCCAFRRDKGRQRHLRLGRRPRHRGLRLARRLHHPGLVPGPRPRRLHRRPRAAQPPLRPRVRTRGRQRPTPLAPGRIPRRPRRRPRPRFRRRPRPLRHPALTPAAGRALSRRTSSRHSKVGNGACPLVRGLSRGRRRRSRRLATRRPAGRGNRSEAIASPRGVISHDVTECSVEGVGASKRRLRPRRPRRSSVCGRRTPSCGGRTKAASAKALTCRSPPGGGRSRTTRSVPARGRTRRRRRDPRR